MKLSKEKTCCLFLGIGSANVRNLLYYCRLYFFVGKKYEKIPVTFKAFFPNFEMEKAKKVFIMFLP